MDIQTIKKIIQANEAKHIELVKQTKTAERYYKNQNDIIRQGGSPGNDPIRKADNRIPRNFHKLLVNQKAAYMFTAPPLFDTKDKQTNEKIADALGDMYAKICKDLCVNASNGGTAWLHYWINEHGGFEYGIVDTKQIIPIYSTSLKRKLIAVLRNYKDVDSESGEENILWEYWTEMMLFRYKQKNDSLSADIEPDYFCTQVKEETGREIKMNKMEHNFGAVPFIPFPNNNIETNDLIDIKPLIDAYDKVFSGFLNDLEDTQEVIFILTNYGGVDLKEFLDDIKKYKAIKVDDDGSDGKGGVETLTISIPIEARQTFLDITRKAIFEQGQGVDPDPQKFGNSSGEALKYLYSLLELKAGLMETEFKLGFGELVRTICRWLNVECKQIVQIWTRTAIRNDTELASICTNSKGVISDKTILKNHPFVENAEEEEKQIKKERKTVQENYSQYKNGFGKKLPVDEEVNLDGKEK